jgi:inorganic pyrophosphatase
MPDLASFPFDFGFIPSTPGEDGTPVGCDGVGCLLEVRIIGAIEAEQTQDGKTEVDCRQEVQSDRARRPQTRAGD